MTRSAAAAAAFAVLLAGCIVAEPKPSAARDAEAAPGAPQAETGDGLGAIEGVAVDDSLNPLANVLVGFDSGHQMLTDETGAFAFSRLEPNTYTLFASSIAHEPSSLRVEVQADEISKVTITLVPLPSNATYFETIPQSGLMACGIGGHIPGAGNWTFAACGPVQWTGMYDIDRFMLDWPEATPIADISGFIGETVWTSNQALSVELTVIWWMSNSPYSQVTQNAATYASTNLAQESGRSPVVNRIEREDVEDETEDVCDLANADCFLMSGHYPASHSFNTPVDQTFIFQQRYEDFLTIFHGGVLPETFTALPDA